MAASLDRDPVSWSCRDRISDADRAFTRKRRVGGDLLLSFGGFASVDLTSRRIRPQREADGQRRDRIAFPRARVRLSAGRDKMSRELQVLCFLAGANSIFFGEKLLTTDQRLARAVPELVV